MEIEQTFLYREIHQQPAILRLLLEQEIEAVERLVKATRQRQVAFVMIAARGTSDNAGRYAQYLLGAVNHLPVALATPSLFTIYQQPPRLKDALVIGISQSGKSPDIVGVLAEGQRQGALTVAITNEPDSDLAQVADHIVALHAGEERAVAATKTYTSELMAISLFSTLLAQDEAMLTALQHIPDQVAETLQLDQQVAQIAPRYRYMRDGVVIGRGFNYATAYEMALKLKELTYTIVEPYSSADFLHGPLALVEHGFPAITIAPSGKMLPEMQSFMRTLQERGAEVVAISDDLQTLELGDIPLRLPVSVPEWLSPLTTIVPGQLLAMHLACIRRYDPDRPRGIRKVTETL